MDYYPTVEAPVYSDEISQRQRRSLRQIPHSKRYELARRAQDAAGFRIRISRAVLNNLAFRPELERWTPFVQAEPRIAERRSMGNLALTLFDTAQQPLTRAVSYSSEEELHERLEIRHPQLFANTEPIPVIGLALFGNTAVCPFIGLKLGGDVIREEITVVRRVVAPELSLDSIHLPLHTPHVSLGKVLNPGSVRHVVEAIESYLPQAVQFKPAHIEFEHA